MEFRLYKEEHRIFGFDDYGALLAECIGAKSILEFGPGISTLALIESGAERVVTCEYQDRWFVQAVERLKGHEHVSVHRYLNDPVVLVDGLPLRQFDLAFVDSPLGQPSRGAVKLRGEEDCNRLNTVRFALQRANTVLLHDAKRDGEGNTLHRVSADGYRVEMIDTVKGIARITSRIA